MPRRPHRSEAASRLHDLQQRFDALFDQNPDAVYFMDLEGRITSANRAACDIMGYAMDQLCGMRASRLIAPEDRDVARARFADAVGGLSQDYEVAALTGNGRRLEV